MTLKDNIEKKLSFTVYSTVQILNKAPYISTILLRYFSKDSSVVTAKQFPLI